MNYFYVGRSDCKPMTAKQSGLGRPCKHRKFKSYKKAVEFLSNHPQQHLVVKGYFYLDAPEGFNPQL